MDVEEDVRENKGGMAKIKNRIVGSGEEQLDQIMFNPRNWRIHPLSQQDALKGVLEEVGWVQQVIVNKRTGNLIDGHLRCQLAAREGAKTIPVVYVDVSEDEEALVLATLDPIGAMAATDKQKLDELFAGIESENENVRKMMDEIAEKEKLVYGDNSEADKYTRNIQAPIYEPKGDKPAVSDLFDDKRTKELIAEIESSDLPDDEKVFLRIAANRHTVLNYKRIAEYYSHSNKQVQSLMENSALVIIDFDKAIELGYVKLSKEISEQYIEDYGEE